jgi:hypothetical protein
MSHPDSHEFDVEGKCLHGISKLAKEDRTVLVVYKNTPVRFDISYSKDAPVQKTCENFKHAAKGIITEPLVLQGIIAWLGHCKMILEQHLGKIAINPDKLDKLITALRTAVDNDGTLDKEATSYNDIFDAFRLALKFYHFGEAS